MPEMNGLEVQRRLAQRDRSQSVVFLSGRGDVPTSVYAMKAGAIDFLVKPVDPEVLLEAVRRATEVDRQHRLVAAQTAERRKLLDRLTIRERQVLECLSDGLMNKQAAARLGIVEKTVKVHRASGLAKLGVRSIADLLHKFPELSLSADVSILDPRLKAKRAAE
jgi:FixJ family two-component response regulator